MSIGPSFICDNRSSDVTEYVLGNKITPRYNAEREKQLDRFTVEDLAETTLTQRST